MNDFESIFNPFERFADLEVKQNILSLCTEYINTFFIP